MRPIRVVVADDHVAVRAGVQALLESEDDLVVCAECGDFGSLLAIADAERPDVVVTDIRMPPTWTDEGVRASVELNRMSQDIGVVVLSQYADVSYALALFATGTARRAYVLKNRSADAMLSAVRSVAVGGSYVDPEVVSAMIDATRSVRTSAVMALTPRELEVLNEVATGLTNAAIAARLFVSERAIEKHINSIFTKLGLSNEAAVHKRVRAVLMYLDEQHQEQGATPWFRRTHGERGEHA